MRLRVQLLDRHHVHIDGVRSLHRHVPGAPADRGAVGVQHGADRDKLLLHVLPVVCDLRQAQVLGHLRCGGDGRHPRDADVAGLAPVPRMPREAGVSS